MAQKPNIILVSVDSLRFDCVPWESDRSILESRGIKDFPSLPTLSRLGDRSVRFMQAITTAPQTASAHASLLTGLYTPQHGVRRMMRDVLSRDVRSLPELLTERGYQTLLYTDHLRMLKAIHLTRGFQHVCSSTDELLRLAAADERPTFALVHFMDVHYPYMICPAPGPGENDDFFDTVAHHAKRHGRDAEGILCLRENSADLVLSKQVFALFAGCPDEQQVHLSMYVKGIEKFDAGRLRRFLDGLDRTCPPDRTVLALFADHGESVVPAKVPQHEGALWEDAIRIPMLLRPCGAVSDRTVGDQVSIADIAPTFLTLAGINAPLNETRAPLSGRDVSGLTGGGSLEAAPVFCEGWTGVKSEATLRVVKQARKENPRLRRRPLAHLRRYVRLETCARTSSAKYVVRGGLGKESPEIRAMNFQSFVNHLRGDIMGLSERPQRIPFRLYPAAIPWLREFITRREIASLGRQGAAKYRIVDLTRGKGDDHVTAVLPGLDRWDEFESHLDLMIQMEHLAVPSEMIRLGLEEEEALVSRLRALGYVD